MPLLKTDSIILRAYKSGETSKLIVFYCPSLGKIKAVANGARKPTSRLVGSLEQVTETSLVIHVKTDREIQIVSQADVVTPFGRLKADVERYAYGSAICELADRLTDDRDGGTSGLYHLLRSSLIALDADVVSDAESIFWHFELRAIEMLGYRPDLENCVVCRDAVTEEAPRVSVRMGGVLCDRCEGRDAQRVRFRPETTGFLRHLQRVAASRTCEMGIERRSRGEVAGFLRAFLEYHTDDRRRLKTLDFLEKMRASESRADYGARG